MTATAAAPTTATSKLTIITPDQYEVLTGPPVKPPTPKELFDFQIETLKLNGLAKYAHADPFRNWLPEGLFLLVPPPPKVLELAELMAHVVLDGKSGVNYLSVESLTDLVHVPTTVSLLVDVEDGRARLNIKPLVSRAAIKKEGRHSYTTWRGIIHGALFPWVLNHHNMDLVGSQYGVGCVPRLYRHDKEPALNRYWKGYADPKWGAPSAGSVLVP